MARPTLGRVLRTVTLALALGAASAAQAQVPAGDAFEVVHSPNFEYHFWSHLASSARGGFIVAWNWQHRGTPILDRDVMLRPYDAAGAPRRPGLMANTWTTGNQLVRGRPGIARVRDRDFVVTWEEYWSLGARGRVVGPDGGPRDSEFGLGIRADGVAGAADGSFVVVGVGGGTDTTYDVTARLFDSRGVSARPAFRVNTYTTGHQFDPAVAGRADGAFVVVWESVDDGTGVFGQRFAAGGMPLGGEFQVDDQTAGYRSTPSVAMDEEGGFAVAWEQSTPESHGLYLRRFDPSGVPLSAPVLVDAANVTDTFPTVAGDGSGNVVVTWQRGTFSDGYGVWGRRFRADGRPREEPFEVAPIHLWASLPSVSSDPSGNFVVSWGLEAYGYFLLPDRVLARRFGGLRPAAAEVDSAASAVSNGNGVLEACETVSVQPSWTNHTNGPQTPSGVLNAFSGPAGATYAIADGAASYPGMAVGSGGACTDCYAVTVSCAANRPAFHWDAVLTEQLRPDAQGQTMRWPLHVGDSFADVPRSSPYYRSIETLLHRGITAGCGAGRFCGGDPVTREQMAAFVLLAAEGQAYRPAACGSPRFADVPPFKPLCRYVEELARRGVAGGCGGDLFCPEQPVTRAQMAVFVLRTALPDVDPPACGVPRFSDVPAADPFCRWIEELARRGLAAGCGGGRYCPAEPITREQAAVFLAGGFSLTLSGP